MEQIGRRLESIAWKQSAGIDPNESDETFLNKGYGVAISCIMLYGGNASADAPKDDAPRIADVFSSVDDFLNIGYLHVGIGRARPIYVLYPWAGTQVLCKGAVLPYYEFVHASRLTDAEWKTVLDSDQTPPLPTWLSPITTNEQSSAPPTTRLR